MTYLDWAATAPPYPDILKDAAALAARAYGNPSSLHGAGREARAELESARDRLSEALGLGVAPEPTLAPAVSSGSSRAGAGRLVLTSGGSEADAIVMLSTLRSKHRRTVVISGIEHAAIDEEAKGLAELGLTVRRVKPGSDGLVSPESVVAACDKDTVLVALMAVNNETGAIQAVAETSRAVRAAFPDRPPFIHCDAVQALGTVGFDARAALVDGAAYSAHKLGGPRGVGALYLARELAPLSRGGGQEGGVRPGTENLAGAWAFAEAASRAVAAREAELSRARGLERLLLEGVASIPGATVLPTCRQAGDERYSPFIACLAFPGLGAETMVRLLDDAGVYVSAGAACSGAKKERRVLDAMGVQRDLSFSALRVSFGRDTSEACITAFLETASRAYARYRT